MTTLTPDQIFGTRSITATEYDEMARRHGALAIDALRELERCRPDVTHEVTSVVDYHARLAIGYASDAITIRVERS